MLRADLTGSIGRQSQARRGRQVPLPAWRSSAEQEGNGWTRVTEAIPRDVSDTGDPHPHGCSRVSPSRSQPKQREERTSVDADTHKSRSGAGGVGFPRVSGEAGMGQRWETRVGATRCPAGGLGTRDGTEPCFDQGGEMVAFVT